MNIIKTVTPQGAFGASEYDNKLDSFLRKFAEKYSKDETEWPEKYGTHYKSEDVIMQPECWCGEDDCFTCGVLSATDEEIAEYGLKYDEAYEIYEAPNFWYKPFDFRVWWYKYIGRSVETNKELTELQLKGMYWNLLNENV